ncbi:MAG: hypothetical protein GTO42_01225 [Candidatus Latescibacteria bacterium]|nr:hypothetical protein [Candidatus Latescibacterota bacterium]NIO27151.1 hypothetical protein [Candidatus Latescibacterota bacterium]NIO54675.1 hypothetical protein [Candidatus Latescibacterota bacterium]NIT00758.1 hypothetical protein [Candidatus Latescibacterota bacterium]NIT37681.1 hypothetical protein [Candidatus Latescibacterota bacterium]
MKLKIPKRIAKIGGMLITISGVVNAVLGARIGAILYDAYPGGKMGDVGIIAGVAAVAIGLIIVFLITPIYERTNRWLVVLGGVLTIVLGHLGAITGAIYIGTLGVLLCYLAGIWAIVVAVSGLRRRQV